MCRGIANSVLPALPEDSERLCRLPVPPTVSPSDSEALLPLSDVDSLCVQQALSLLRCAADVSERDEILNSIPMQYNGRIRPNPESVFLVLCRMYFPGNDKILGSGRVSHSMIMWDTLKYSLMSTEIAARSRRTSLSPEYSLNALMKELKSSSGFILSLVLKTVQRTRTKDSLSFLLRLRGIKLFSESICAGFSVEEFSSRSCIQEGIASVLEFSIFILICHESWSFEKIASFEFYLLSVNYAIKTCYFICKRWKGKHFNCRLST